MAANIAKRAVLRQFRKLVPIRFIAHRGNLLPGAHVEQHDIQPDLAAAQLIACFRHGVIDPCRLGSPIRSNNCAGYWDCGVTDSSVLMRATFSGGKRSQLLSCAPFDVHEFGDSLIDPGSFRAGRKVAKPGAPRWKRGRRVLRCGDGATHTRRPGRRQESQPRRRSIKRSAADRELPVQQVRTANGSAERRRPLEARSPPDHRAPSC